jgi:hypothetical protein
MALGNKTWKSESLQANAEAPKHSFSQTWVWNKIDLHWRQAKHKVLRSNHVWHSQTHVWRVITPNQTSTMYLSPQVWDCESIQFIIFFFNWKIIHLYILTSPWFRQQNVPPNHHCQHTQSQFQTNTSNIIARWWEELQKQFGHYIFTHIIKILSL